MLAEFYIGKYEVTNAQYAAFGKATGRSPGGLFGNLPAGKEEYPVVGVTWDDTVAFTQWLSEETGKAFRLCTEAEWEKACRGTSGFIYPWGDTWDANRANGNVEGVFGAAAVKFVMTPVGSFSPAGDSPYGVADMVGNAWERVADWYDDEYFARAPAVNPQGPETGIHQGIRVIRGGTYANGTSATCANRGHGSDFAEPNVGLRVCVSPDLAAPGQ